MTDRIVSLEKHLATAKQALVDSKAAEQRHRAHVAGHSAKEKAKEGKGEEAVMREKRRLEVLKERRYPIDDTLLLQV